MMMMSEWSVKSVRTRHAALRAQYETRCREALEEWLSACVGPVISTRQPQPLPSEFVTPTPVVLPLIPHVMAELIVMAAKMGWDFKLEEKKHVSFRASGARVDGTVRFIDSPWSYDQVLFRYGCYEVESFLAKALGPHVGSLAGVPPVLKFPVELWPKWREQWLGFSLLGWSLELKDIDGKVHMCLSEK